MFNPFCIFSPKLLNAVVKANKRYFVRQTFKRGFSYLDEGIRGYFIISHYDDLKEAQEHFEAISRDGNRFLYDWEDPEHREKLIIASKNPPGFKVYANLFERNWERHITDQFRCRIRRYIEDRLHWRPTRSDTINFHIEMRYGEAYGRIQTRNLEVSVLLEEIETFG